MLEMTYSEQKGKIMLDTDKETCSETYQTNSINLHSLINFKDIIKPLILHPSIKSVCEIGIESFNLMHWLISISKNKRFYYYGVDPTIEATPIFHDKSKFFKESSLIYLNREEAD
ncbi:MAG: hypothetical protein REH83_05160, partial [Rickettsiella sp.]|nr:hypothetical protein [Rickettsiella sp.]